ncbi:MAG: hypothetical protein V1778_00100 [bacterium]
MKTKGDIFAPDRLFHPQDGRILSLTVEQFGRYNGSSALLDTEQANLLWQVSPITFFLVN